MEKLISVVLFLSWAWAILWPIIAVWGGLYHWYYPTNKVALTKLLDPADYSATIIAATIKSKSTALWVLSLCLIYIL